MDQMFLHKMRDEFWDSTHAERERGVIERDKVRDEVSMIRLHTLSSRAGRKVGQVRRRGRRHVRSSLERKVLRKPEKLLGKTKKHKADI